MSANSQFEYQRINTAVDEIRILSLQPGTFDCPISCTISHEPLQAVGDYEALSYCWGDPALSQEICIDSAKFSITEKAACALRHLRTTDKVRRIWIDAVCINQSDLDERLHQVRHMKNIYENASRVLAWLGPEMDGSGDGIALLRFLAQKVQERRAVIPTQPFHELPTSSLRSLLGILRRQYWSRTWIVQEVAVPQKEPLLGCGRQWDTWTTWKNGLYQLYAYKGMYSGPRKGDLPPPQQAIIPDLPLVHGFLDLDRIRRSVHRELSAENPTNLLDILKYTDRKEASDPRDHIFAVLGLIKTDEGANAVDVITPDYAKTVWQVYCEMAKFAVESDRNLEILYFRNHIRGPGLPSWLPDFSKRSDRFPPNAPDHWHKWSPTNYRPGISYIDSGHFPRVSDDLKSLTAHGRIVSRVHRILNLTGIRVDPLEVFSRIRSFALPGKLPSYWGSPELFYFKDALWRTLLGNRSEENTMPCPGSYRNTFDQLMMDTVGDQSEPSIEVQIFLRAVCNAVSFSETGPHRCLFMMADNRFGLGTPECREGDLICVVHCYSMPIILRPVGNHFEYVGDCYVHDIMNGQEVPEFALGEGWMSFTIC
ncbi:heterokaryon incompatibility protein-domain-containing protein [Echria macrotheca]|uniref:Heterokaryon incompatibility protein-domain-containing protein n=1 Tax=Echria macrotheca TaxID=438768 RepID=A0AAJ0FF80_9PEZI|nr:heterokaryon incompatibility protein-domain-containing protein [Echria macrotheca]